ncbi:hypothetical protein GOFOIKOB_5525 [Methylobacterium tardum]|nr:hypothetical protein GOFOIKOB_5525 [Methylobacterium tardum]
MPAQADPANPSERHILDPQPFTIDTEAETYPTDLLKKPKTG